MSDPVQPRVILFEGRPKESAGALPGPHVVVPHGQRVLLRYKTEGVTKVKVRCVSVDGEVQDGAEFQPGGEGEFTVHPTTDCEYSLQGFTPGERTPGDDLVLSGGLVYVDVHDPAQPVSPRASTRPPPALVPLAECSLLLCGPMLRLVEPPRAPVDGVAGDEGSPGHVCVFVATQRPCRVQLRVFEGGPLHALPPPPELKKAATPTTPLGPRLHVALVDLQGLALAPGAAYSYDLSLQPLLRDLSTDDGPAQTLASLGLLSGPLALGYEDGVLPSFLAPPDKLEELRVLHGSCRKLHGQGEDALALADDLVAELFTPGRAGRKGLGEKLGSTDRLRPHQLLLTGDQIYADDVPVAFCKLVGELAEKLLCPWTKDGTRDPQPDLRFLDCGSGRYEPGEVRARMHRGAIPEVGHGLPGHLIFLGEFLATYLLAFSPELWPKDAAGQPTLEPAGVDEPGKPIDEYRFWNLAREFAGQVGRARRVFANVPSLMICDDHEVTNNWNVHRAWVDNLRSSPRARRIARNALSAYAIFQDWGNRPAMRRAAMGDPSSTGCGFAGSRTAATAPRRSSSIRTCSTPCCCPPQTPQESRPAPSTSATHWSFPATGW